MSSTPPTSAPTAFGARLRILRARCGLTQTELAELARKGNNLAGIVESALSHWERGQRLPGFPQLLALGRALEVHLGPQVGQAETLRLLRLAAEESPMYAAWLKSSQEGRDDAGLYRAFVAWASGQATRPKRHDPKIHGASKKEQGGKSTVDKAGSEPLNTAAATLPLTLPG